MIADSSGSKCYDADVYHHGGERVVTNTCPQNYKFTGKERDPETGNDYFGARFDENNLGRFLSPDPAGKAANTLADPQTWNMYAYVRNSPTTLTDPTGLAPCCDLDEITQEAVDSIVEPLVESATPAEAVGFGAGGLVTVVAAGAGIDIEAIASNQQSQADYQMQVQGAINDAPQENRMRQTRAKVKAQARLSPRPRPAGKEPGKAVAEMHVKSMWTANRALRHKSVPFGRVETN